MTGTAIKTVTEYPGATNTLALAHTACGIPLEHRQAMNARTKYAALNVSAIELEASEHPAKPARRRVAYLNRVI